MDTLRAATSVSHFGGRDASKNSTALLQTWDKCLLINTKHIYAGSILSEHKVHSWTPDLATYGKKDKAIGS